MKPLTEREKAMLENIGTGTVCWIKKSSKHYDAGAHHLEKNAPLDGRVVAKLIGKGYLVQVANPEKISPPHTEYFRRKNHDGN